ncbi:MAG: hypothetical protein AUJ51_06175 [Elusimicrobia bacterium CG1_02_56_21]|nr:MAG: hypothetical protein AUJ51_06175 [Elusimicrobia bacterium CG1_02_56_21]
MNCKTEKIIVVTGATGRQGGAVARELLKSGYSVRALTRYPDSQAAKALSGLGAKVIKCDLTDANSHTGVLSGAWGVFALFQPFDHDLRLERETGRRFTATAKNAGIKHYVYSSAAAANLKTGIPYLESKAVIEAAVIGARFESYVIIRPSFLMDNFTAPLLLPEIEQGRLCLALPPHTRVQMVAADDIGKFGRAAFRQAGELSGKEIDIAGDERTPQETADVLGTVYGKKIEFFSSDINSLRKADPEMAAIMDWLDLGCPAIKLQDIPAKYGVRPMTLEQWARKRKPPAQARAAAAACTGQNAAANP